MVALDMTNLETRNRVIAVSAYYALRLELQTGLKCKGNALQAARRLGFTSKTKKAMFAELAIFLGKD